MADSDRDELLGKLVSLLAQHEVMFILFGSEAGRVQGAELRTIDADIVPDAGIGNLERLCEALNTVRPRWRLDDAGHSAPIEGGRLQRRHLHDVVAMGLVTDLGPIDIVMRPRGYEAGYEALAPRAVQLSVGGTEVLVADLTDLIRSKQLLGRDKDRGTRLAGSTT